METNRNPVLPHRRRWSRITEPYTIPESAVLSKYEILPLAIPVELAEEFGWWSSTQPTTGFEQQIGSILPETKSWSTSMRIWGHEESDDAHVLYSDDRKDTVEEIGFRLDANKISPELVRRFAYG